MTFVALPGTDRRSLPPDKPLQRAVIDRSEPNETLASGDNHASWSGVWDGFVPAEPCSRGPSSAHWSVSETCVSYFGRRQSGTSKTAGRLLDGLEMLAPQTRPGPTLMIARECGIPKSSAHHLLYVMRARHFVTYHQVERAWGLGVSVFEIGPAYLRSGPLQRLGRHILVGLTARTSEPPAAIRDETLAAEDLQGAVA